MNITISQKKITNIIVTIALILLIGAGGYYAWKTICWNAFCRSRKSKGWSLR